MVEDEVSTILSQHRHSETDHEAEPLCPAKTRIGQALIGNLPTARASLVPLRWRQRYHNDSQELGGSRWADSVQKQ